MTPDSMLPVEQAATIENSLETSSSTLRAEPAQPPDIDPALLDPDALKVVHRLHQHGHQAYLVGGCVRDLLVGRQPKDFDIATSALPNDVRDIFRNCRLIGRRFRLAHVYFKGGKIIEVSTFRANPTELEAEAKLEAEANGEAAGEVEGAEGNGDEADLLITHDNVFGTAEEDARRRDFTINGLFYDVAAGQVIDYVRGLRDLKAREIRTIGDPEVRMREDPVRMLRAVRFACKLGFDIESRTYAAMEGAVEDLPRCARARLLEETFRLIRGGSAAPCLKLLAALDALKVLLPPIDQFVRAQGDAAFFPFADALDRQLSGGVVLDDAQVLAALLLPLGRGGAAPAAPEAGEEQRPQLAKVIEDMLGEFVRTARLPRRIAERCRMLLMAQRVLSGERRRRGPLSAFRSHPIFEDALAVFEISCAATGEHREALQAWKSGEAPAVAPGAEGPRRKRRRRRGRKGDGAAASEASDAGPSETASEG